MTDAQKSDLKKVISSLPLFAKNFLKISLKKGGVSAFAMNRAQLYLHEKLESQLAETGRIRAIILKGRQQGISTYIQARYFHKVVTQRGKRAFILTHEAEATKNLFGMTKRYYDNCPAGILPVPDASNAKELNFSSMTSGYRVGTAGNKGVGRSQTNQLMHCSEVAFYPHADEHAKGILQTVSDEPGTEIILESTANGMGNYFHQMWLSAETGQSDFIPIFIPWFWQDEYRVFSLDKFALTEDEHDMREMCGEELTNEHFLWRRKKLLDFSSDYETAKELFNTEYPVSALVAFSNPVANRFIKSNLVIQHQKTEVSCPDSHLIIGVDPAISDNDRTAIIRRRSREVYKLETFYNYNTMEIVGLVRKIIDSERPHKVFIDCIGIGAGIVDRLKEAGYECVEGINVARSANMKDQYKNLRAELWGEMREFLAQDMPVQLPDSQELLGDLTSLGYKFDSSGRLQLESKEDLRSRGMKSCDCADALALTFAMGHYASESPYAKMAAPKFAFNTSGMFT